MKNNLDTPVAKQCRALYTKYAYGHTYGLLKVGLRCIVLAIKPDQELLHCPKYNLRIWLGSMLSNGA